MPIKNILVHVEDAERSGHCLEAATKLALEHDAHLTGLGVRTPVYMPAYAAAQVPPEVFSAFDEEQEGMLKQARQMFDAKMAAAGWTNRSSWMTGNGDIASVIADKARCSDLIILRQEDSDRDVGVFENVPDNVILAAGRPVLVIPYIGFGDKIGTSVLVAWNNTREAARAVGDALPLMARAERVEILSANPEEGEEVPGANLARYLSEHGIAAEANRTLSKDIDVGDMLLNDIAESGHDLIVMGGYGHSRIREMIMGGVTRHLLQHMTVPVLLSH